MVCALLGGAALRLAAFTPTEDGVYAVFTTNHGEFAARLFYEDAPHTVANFVGLAEGSGSWRDLQSGAVRQQPFYDGLTFHRVIDEFMIQGGSPNGLGTDGPGYTIADEIRADRLHTKAGVLSMAKTAYPNTGGSQFFITLDATTWLDGAHSVFGEIVAGLPVVQAIGKVETGDGDRPVQPVVMQSVEILRRGAAAEAFDVRAYGVPEVAVLPVEWEVDGLALEFEGEPKVDYHFFSSTDLVSWSAAGLVAPTTAGTQSWSVASRLPSAGRYFVRPSKAERVSREDGTGAELTLDLGESGILVLKFTSATAGEYYLNDVGGALSDYRWYELGSTIQIHAAFANLLPMQIYLQGGSAASQGGVLVRVLRPSRPDGSEGPFNITGTYELE